MVDKHGVPLTEGDLVVINENVQPRYIGGALCRVTGGKRGYSDSLWLLNMEVEKVKAGGRRVSNARFREGTNIVRISNTIVKKV